MFIEEFFSQSSVENFLETFFWNMQDIILLDIDIVTYLQNALCRYYQTYPFVKLQKAVKLQLILFQ